MEQMSYLQGLFNQARKAELKKKAQPITFIANGIIYTKKAVPYNDAFYEIVGGEFDGNLVHRWDVMEKRCRQCHKSFQPHNSTCTHCGSSDVKTVIGGTVIR